MPSRSSGMKCRLVAAELTLFFLAGRAFSSANDKIQCSRDIQPILADNCYQCHGPDPKARKAKLRLDDEAVAKKSVIVPGKSGDSELYRRLTTDDAEERMPPKHTNRKLTPG